MFVIVWGLCLLLWGGYFCYCEALCLLLWVGLCLLLPTKFFFLFGCSDILKYFRRGLLRFEVGASSGVVCTNL